MRALGGLSLCKIDQGTSVWTLEGVLVFFPAGEWRCRVWSSSQQTSGGTVLSTNWSEVKGKNYEAVRLAGRGAVHGRTLVRHRVIHLTAEETGKGRGAGRSV